MTRRLMDGQETSEFGKAFLFNLCCFAQHIFDMDRYHLRTFMDAKRGVNVDLSKVLMDNETVDSAISHQLWYMFDGATDHLQEMIIPDSLPDWLREKVKLLHRKSLYIKDVFLSEGALVTLDDYSEIVSMLKEIMADLDYHVFGIEPIEGEYS